MPRVKTIAADKKALTVRAYPELHEDIKKQVQELNEKQELKRLQKKYKSKE